MNRGNHSGKVEKVIQNKRKKSIRQEWEGSWGARLDSRDLCLVEDRTGSAGS